MKDDSFLMESHLDMFSIDLVPFLSILENVCILSIIKKNSMPLFKISNNFMNHQFKSKVNEN